MTRELVPIGAAAEALGLSVPQLRRLANASRIPVVVTEGGHRRFDVRAVRSALGGLPILGPTSPIPARAPDWQERLVLAGLSEETVWRGASPALGLAQGSETYKVFHYTFTEMLNNAIDHSGGEKVTCEAWGAENVVFRIVDDGVGAFARLQTDLGLPDLESAVLQLSKGKGTSDPSRHSGQGIFFTSKIADVFRLEANGLAWTVDNTIGDQALGISLVTEGTNVVVRFSSPPSRTTEEVFKAFTDEDFAFSKTRPSVKLAQIATSFVSRSEAKRLLSRLEAFEEVELDFADVDAVGQGFVDEVFRVWAREHPTTRLTWTNANPAVEFMIRRGLRG